MVAFVIRVPTIVGLVKAAAHLDTPLAKSRGTAIKGGGECKERSSLPYANRNGETPVTV